MAKNTEPAESEAKQDRQDEAPAKSESKPRADDAGVGGAMPEKPSGTVTEDVERESTVDDPLEQREDDTARERSTSPVPRVGDTWESMVPADERDRNGPRRRIGVLAIEGDKVLVTDKSTRRHSHIALESFAPPKWRFIG